jgi:hypothetical protein
MDHSSTLCTFCHNFFTAYFLVTSLQLSLVSGAYIDVIILVKCPIFGLDTKTYWLTDRQSQCDFDFDFDWQLASDWCLALSKGPNWVGVFHLSPEVRNRTSFRNAACSTIQNSGQRKSPDNKNMSFWPCNGFLQLVSHEDWKIHLTWIHPFF